MPLGRPIANLSISVRDEAGRALPAGVVGEIWIAGAGLADQAVLAIANAGNTLLAAALLARGRSGNVMLSITIAYFVIGINRAFVGEVLLTLASRYDGERRDRLVRDGAATALGIGLVSSALFVGIWAARPHWGNTNLQDLIWLAPFVPLILLHDTGRYTYLADRKPARALVVDLVWVGTQATVIVIGLVTVGRSAGGLLPAWGLGATAGFAVFMGRERIAFWRGDPRRWAGQTRRLSGWFTATALIGQVQTLVTNFLVQNRLSPEALSGLRTAQTTMLQPVQNFQLAVQSLLIPRLSRLAAAASGTAASGTAETDQAEAVAAVAALRRQVRVVVMAFAGLAALTVAVVWPVASFALSRVEKFADIAPLALPISLQSAVYLIQVPFTAALRGMHQAPLLFAQYAVFAVTSLTGLVVGADTGGLLGASWGLTIGATVGMAVMVSLYWYALHRLGWSSRTR